MNIYGFYDCKFGALRTVFLAQNDSFAKMQAWQCVKALPDPSVSFHDDLVLVTGLNLDEQRTLRDPFEKGWEKVVSLKDLFEEGVSEND